MKHIECSYFVRGNKILELSGVVVCTVGDGEYSEQWTAEIYEPFTPLSQHRIIEFVSEEVAELFVLENNWSKIA